MSMGALNVTCAVFSVSIYEFEYHLCFVSTNQLRQAPSNSHTISMYVCRKPPGSNTPKWFKFDDGDVTEAKIEDDEVAYALTVFLFNQLYIYM